jgi:hypothetical protein
MILHYVRLTLEENNQGTGRYWDWDNPEYPHSPLACLIGHEALFEGVLREPSEGYTYSGMDNRGLPVHFETECEEWESWQLEAIA